MATQGTLTIQNSIPNTNLYITVTNTDCNCCDFPLQNDVVGVILPNSTFKLNYIRTEGHGCKGKQGIFNLFVLGNSIPLGTQDFSFDDNGGIAFNNPAAGTAGYPLGFTSSLTGTPDNMQNMGINFARWLKPHFYYCFQISRYRVFEKRDPVAFADNTAKSFLRRISKFPGIANNHK